MFYIKTELASGKTVRTDITDENVFTRCPECGRELPVDIAEVFSDGEGDLFSTSIVCSACTKKRNGQRSHMDGMKITADGLALLADTLCRSGYGLEVRGIFESFEIDTVSDLETKQYERFADALKSLATGNCDV